MNRIDIEAHAPRATHDEYRARAADCSDRAAAATLSNVRERELRAEMRWLELADQAERVAIGTREREAATRARSGR